MEAVLCLQAVVGIEESTRALIHNAVNERQAVSADAPGQLFLGVIVGLLAAQLHFERSGSLPGPS